MLILLSTEICGIDSKLYERSDYMNKLWEGSDYMKKLWEPKAMEERLDEEVVGAK